MRMHAILIVGGTVLLGACTVSSEYSPATGYSATPAASTTVTYQPAYVVTTYTPAPSPYPWWYSPEGSPPHANWGGTTK